MRRTAGVLRCGAEQPFTVPSSLSSVGPELLLVPLATPTGLLGVFAVAPSASEPLVVSSARRFLAAYAELSAYLVDRAQLHEGFERALERRTRALTEVIVDLERRCAHRSGTTADDEPVRAATLPQGGQ